MAFWMIFSQRAPDRAGSPAGRPFATPALRHVRAPRGATRPNRLFWLVALVAVQMGTGFVVVSPLRAQGATVSSPPELARAADHLKPGQWVWAPGIAPQGPLLIYVDLSRQLATVYRNGVRIAISTISSGKEGYATPTGVFTILQKDATHHSNKYHDAPMPFQERLTWDGVALHAGGLPGFPESHGCVHLPYSFAQALFGVTSLGATVVISGDAASHIRTTDSSLLSTLDDKGQSLTGHPLDGEDFYWAPEKSPIGPMTIIISKLEQRIVVLRNGVEIGRSVARINDNDAGSHVVNLSIDSKGQHHWIYVGLPGHNDEAGREVDEATLNRVVMPRAFYEDVHKALQPGATILITQSSVGDDGRATHVTIMDGVSVQPPAPAS